MARYRIFLAFTAALASPAIAQAPPALEAIAAPVAGTVLPRNTPVVLSLNQTLNTKSKSTKVGERFAMTVSRHVKLDGFIVIPRGTKGVGRVTYRTKKGGFGKSGKIEIELEHIEIGDLIIPITAKQRVEGEGNSTATIGTFVFLSMLGAGLITGHSAEIQQGTEITAWTDEDIPVVFPTNIVAAPLSPSVVGDAITAAPTAEMRTAARLPPRRDFRMNSSVVCETCRR